MRKLQTRWFGLEFGYTGGWWAVCRLLLGTPVAACSGCGERDGGIGHGKRRSRTGLARVCGNVQLVG